MSQAGVLDVVASTPEIPIQFDTDSGSAVPVANVLNILGGTGVTTVGSGNTVTIDVTGSVATTYIANTGTATPAANDIDILGNYVLAGSAPCSTSASGHTLLVNVQLSTASASSAANSAGVCSFSSADFSVDANGYVTFSGSGSAETLTGNSGGAVGPTAGNIDTVGTGSITIVGNPGTSTLTTELTGLTAHAVLVGAGTATITKVGPTATSGQVLQSQGSSSDPAFSTATYPSSTTINQVLYSSANNVVGGITAGDNGVLISGTTGVPSWLANSGTAGYVLTANSAAPPSWQSVGAAGAITTIDGDSGSITPTAGVVTIKAGNSTQTCGSSVLFVNSASTSILKVTDSNDNTIIGASSGNASISGLDNASLGFFTLSALTSGGNNVACGAAALTKCTSGSNNTAVGQGALTALVSGGNNTCIGQGAGSAFTTVETNNISIGVGVGTIGDEGITRIGAVGSVNAVYIAGIEGVSVSNLNIVTINTSTNQLGSETVLGVANGGTAATSFNINGVVISNTTTTGALAALTLTSGQLVIGGTSTPAAATLTAGAGISISNGNNSITISSSGGGFTWHDVTGGSATLAAQNGYKADLSTLTTFTLPTNNALGDTIIIMGGNTGGWKIVYGAGQYIQFGSTATTTTTGNLASTNSFDSCTLVCITASASAPIFQVLSSVGNLAVT